jgi:uncharacterized membrane protein YcaP (DUF421 family)
MMTLETIFGTAGDLTTGQMCARAVLVTLWGLVLVRVAGRRMFGKWAALDIVVAIMVGSNLSRAVTGAAPLFGTLVATALMVGLHWMLANAAARWRFASRILEGKGVELGRDGGVDKRALVANNVTAADIAEALHRVDLERPDQTRRLVLAPSGRIFALKRGRG